MAGPCQYFGAWDYAEAGYSHSTLVVAAALPYPKSRWEKVLATIEQQWLVHSMEAAVEYSCAFPDGPGHETQRIASGSSQVTYTDLPELADSSGEEDNFREDPETLSSESETDYAEFTPADYMRRLHQMFGLGERSAEASAAQHRRSWLHPYSEFLEMRRPSARSNSESQALDTILVPMFPLGWPR